MLPAAAPHQMAVLVRTARRFRLHLQDASEGWWVVVGTEIETSASDAGAADLAVWEEERVALEAIYDGDVLFPSEQQTLLSVDADGTRLTLDFRIRPGGAYPDDLPMIGVR